MSNSSWTSSRKSRLDLGIGICLALILVLFYVPIASFLAQGMIEGGPENYQKLGEDTYYASVILTSFRLALYITLVDLLIAIPFCLTIANRSPGYQLVCIFFVMIPFWSSQLIRVYAWTIIFGRTGILNDMLMFLGITSSPYQFIGSEIAVVGAMAHVMLPYMVLPIYIALTRIPADLHLCAKGLGASPLAVLRTITLPLAAGGIIGGSILVFIISLGTYVSVAILGAGRIHVMATAIEQQITVLGNWSMASTLSLVLLVITSVLYVAIKRYDGRGNLAGRQESK